MTTIDAPPLRTPVATRVAPPRAGPGALRFELAEGPAAAALLASEALHAAWDALRDACPWATVFQGRGFVSTWFDVYGDLFIPVVVTATDAAGGLAGLLVLAATPNRRSLHVAGAHQCEYQTWLARPEHGEEFVPGALRALGAAFPAASLSLVNVPPGAPLAWAADGACGPARLAVEPMPRGLRDLAEDGGGSLKKKGNKSRLKQLGRQGDVTFERITDPAAFARFLDEFVPVHDFRQGAVHGVLPFADDPRKRRFHEALLGVPGLLYVTALRVGGRLVAGHIDVADGETLVLGPHTYAPAFSRQSPGKILTHMLAERLAGEGFATIDMTPGGGWKDRFATRGDEVRTVRLFFRRADHAAYRARRRRDDLAKRAALAVGSSPERVRDLIARARRHGVTGTVRAALRRLTPFLPPRESRSLVVCTIPAEEAARTRSPGLFRVDCLEDLMCFEPLASWEHRTRFLSRALDRLAAGHHVYTRVEDGVLVCRGWLAPAECRSNVPEIGAEIALPGGAFVAYDFFTHPAWRGRGLYDAVLRQILADAGSDPACREVWIGADTKNAVSARGIERVGFRPLVTLRSERLLGATVRRDNHRALHVHSTPLESLCQTAKRAVYGAARALGLFRLARTLTRHELRILCWHGFELDDESEFGPRLFMPRAAFERRLDAIARGGHTVLPLAEAVDRLAQGTLPDAAVVLTIDDGAASTAGEAIDLLESRSLPATLYVTTYHVQHQTPVFETSLAYLFWRSEKDVLDLTGLGPYREGTVRLDDDNATRAAGRTLVEYAKSHLDEAGRQALGREVASRLEVDWDEHAASRRCGLLTPDELRALARRGIDLQLHTHRHRLPANEADTVREIQDNRAALAEVLPGTYDHLCYPSNEHDPRQFPWLRALGVKSGTTCNVGLNPPGTDPLALRRFLDGACVSQIEFEAELSGFAELVRRVVRRGRRRKS